MGREIRRVPGDWEHPRYTKEDAPYPHFVGEFKPLYDQDYSSACEEWYGAASKWVPDEHYQWYHEAEGNPPDEDSYRSRKWTPEEATHYQVYETVSEGTPVTPAFATKEELIEYLVKFGDFWDQHTGDFGWTKENAEGFVKREYAPSLTVDRTASGVTIKSPRDGA
jgi:hypothetical protein